MKAKGRITGFAFSPAWVPALMVLISLSCRNPARPVPLPKHAGTEKIFVSRDQVYDLSGYADEGDGNPWCLFDENAFVDPRYPGAGTGFSPVTNCQPQQHREIYFGPHGSRVVVDLNRFYRLKEIWIFDGSSHRDSVNLSTGNLRNWHPVAALRSNGFWQRSGWRMLPVDERTRFVQITFSSPKTAITEMVLYGDPEPDSAQGSLTESAATTVNGQRSSFIDAGLSSNAFTSKPLNQFLGVNYIVQPDPRWLKPFHYSRLYNFALDFDDDTVHEGKDVRFNMLHYGHYDSLRGKYVFLIDTGQQINNGNIWYSIRGVSRRLANQGYDDKDRPLDRPGMDPELPASYTRHARMMWNMAAFFGYSRVDTNRMSLSHRPLVSGRGSMHLFENGNEEDAWWVGKKYADPVSIFAQTSADWDGDEGRLGEGTGIHQADTGARLMMSGLVGLDTNRVKVYRLLSDQLRNDHRFVWTGGIQYHHYSNQNNRGISPEEDSLRMRLATVRATTRRIAPGVDCFLGETGYDKSQQSINATPLIPGSTAAQSQAIMLLRTVNASFFSGFDACILYWLEDGDPQTDPRTYLTSGLLRNLGKGKSMAYPSWYRISGMVNALGKYVPDSIVSEKGEVWIYRYRNLSYPDSLAFFAYSPTVTGKRIGHFLLNTGSSAGFITEVTLSDSTDLPRSRRLPASAGKTEVEIGEDPAIFFWKR